MGKSVKLTKPAHIEGGGPIFVFPEHVVTIRQIVVDPDPANAKVKKQTLTALVTVTGYELHVTESPATVLKAFDAPAVDASKLKE